MQPRNNHQSNKFSRPFNFRQQRDSYFVWVMAPYLETSDNNLKDYYDFTQSHGEFVRVFEELGCEWEWLNVTLNNIEELIHRIKTHRPEKLNIVINQCDGDEMNAVPGISVVHALEENNVIYTGSEAFFYDITTSKIPMKKAFNEAGVPTASWKVIDGIEVDPKAVFNEVGDVLIVKPAISAGSMGLSIKNVVSTEQELTHVLNSMRDGFRGWKLDTGGIFVEQFVSGREFTTFMVGSYSNPGGIKVYEPVERVFHSSLPEKEQFLSYDRLWATFDNEAPLPDEGNLYEYSEVDPALIPQLKEISIKAFESVRGTGYARLDIRMDRKTGKFYVLEINAQCGLSEDENYTSIGAILRFCKQSFTNLIIEIMEDALIRHERKQRAVA